MAKRHGIPQPTHANITYGLQNVAQHTGIKFETSKNIITNLRPRGYFRTAHELRSRIDEIKKALSSQYSTEALTIDLAELLTSANLLFLKSLQQKKVLSQFK